MVTICDQKLKSNYQTLEGRFRLDPNVKVDAAALPKLLAAVGDSSRFSGAQMEAKLSAPGITRDQQLELVKAGMSAGEKKDLEAILDKGTVPLTDDVKKFLNQLVGRAEVLRRCAARHRHPDRRRHQGHREGRQPD